MTPKRSTLEEPRSTLREIIDRGEEVVSVFVEELTGSASLREELEKTVRRATRARKTVDRNLEAILGALNLPTRRDYAKLREEIHALQGAITNLNMKMDRLIAATSRSAESASHRPSEIATTADGPARSAVGSAAPPRLAATAARRRKTAGKKKAVKKRHRRIAPRTTAHG